MARPGQRLNSIETTVPLDELKQWILSDLAHARLVKQDWDANSIHSRNPQRRGMSRVVWAHGGKLARMNGIGNPSYDQCWTAVIAHALGLTAQSVQNWREGRFPGDPYGR